MGTEGIPTHMMRCLKTLKNSFLIVPCFIGTSGLSRDNKAILMSYMKWFFTC